MSMLANIKKFSFGEMTSNNNGKTSATSTAGLYIILIGGFSFFLGVIDKMFIDKSVDIINQAVMFTTIGAALLGVKNVMGAKNAEVTPTDTPTETPAEDQPLNS